MSLIHLLAIFPVCKHDVGFMYLYSLCSVSIVVIIGSDVKVLLCGSCAVQLL